MQCRKAQADKKRERLTRIADYGESSCKILNCDKINVIGKKVHYVMPQFVHDF